MKKAALVITQAEMGGAQKNLLLLVSSLKGKYDFTVYSSGGGKLVDALKVEGIKHVEVPSLVREINPKADYKAYRFLKREFKQEKYDIVHCHSSKAGILGRIAAWTTGVDNIIYTAHGFVFNEPMSAVKKAIYVAAEWFCARISHYLICVSPLDLSCTKRYHINSKKNRVYIPNGIDFTKELTHKSTIRKELNIPEKLFLYGSVANFYETKGHRYLIDAYKKLSLEKDDIGLILVGDGRLRGEMEELSKTLDHVYFTGYREDAESIIQAMDIFVLSSVKEGFPFVLLEAISKKIPIITTKVGAVPEILEHGKDGVIVPVKDEDALKVAMSDAYENREKYIKMATDAYKYCSREYSLKNMVDKTSKIYD